MSPPVEYRRFVPAEADLLAEFLTAEDWPFFSGGTPDAAQVRAAVAAGRYDSDQTRSFWIVAGADRAGLIRLFDLTDDTPLFELRIGAAHRGAGLGTRALRGLTEYLFTEFPGIRRIEGTTRADNDAMRRTLRTCGYVKESHWRQAWPGRDGTIYDAVGYAILRTDWETGTVTPPDWDDEPTPTPTPTP